MFSVEEWQREGTGAFTANTPATTGCAAALPRTDKEALKSGNYSTPTGEGNAMLRSEVNYINLHIILYNQYEVIIRLLYNLRSDCCILFGGI